jgi:hypothetical protein
VVGGAVGETVVVVVVVGGTAAIGASAHPSDVDTVVRVRVGVLVGTDPAWLHGFIHAKKGTLRSRNGAQRRAEVTRHRPSPLA